MKIRTIALSIVALVIIALMASCTSNKEPGDGPNPEPDPGKEGENGTEVMVQFTVRLPAHAKPEAPSTYAITEKEEDHVKTIEVLLFNADDEYTGKPYYCSVISDDGDAGVTNKKKFTIALPIGGPYTVVILANSKNAVDLALKGKPALKNSSKSDILALLEKEQIGKWNTTSDTNFDPIPMWGEIADVTVKKNVSLNARLTRMVSRVDIELAVGARSLFELKKVHLYNRYTKGMIAPYKLSWNGAKASDPSIPTGATTTKGPQEYEVTNNISLKGEIYAFEAPVEADDQKSTCLILEGEYDGTKTFYRVDFANKEGGVLSLLPLLRNHSYDITISKIKGLGAGSAEEAFKQGTGNAGDLDYEIIVIDDSDITTIIYNGKYMLGFSQDEFLLSNLERTAADTDNILKVMSNVPSGWKIDKISYDVVGGEDWLSVPANQKEGDGSKTSISLLLMENKGAVDRVGYLHFSAGSLKHKVKVTQERLVARLSIDKTLFDDLDGLGMGHDMYLSDTDSLFNISSNTYWEIVSSHPGVLYVDRDSGTGDSEIKVILQPSSLLAPKNDYTLTITGTGTDAPVVIDVKQYGMDIYVGNDKGGATKAMLDNRFIAACKTHVPRFDGGDNKLSIAEAVSFTGKLFVAIKSITSLKGVEYFRNLTILECGNNQLAALDVSKNLKLTQLNCIMNQIIVLDVSKNKKLTLLSCAENKLTKLDVTQNTKLIYLFCRINPLTELNVTENIELITLNCASTQISELDVSKNLELTVLNCEYNQLTSLDVSKNQELIYLYCQQNQLNGLDVTQNKKLIQLHCYQNPLTLLDVSKNLELIALYCDQNQLNGLDVSMLEKLTHLRCGSNSLTTLNVSNNKMLIELWCYTNQLPTLDVSNNLKLRTLVSSKNPLTSNLNVTMLKELEKLDCSNNQLSTLDVSKNLKLTQLNCGNNQLTTLNVTILPELDDLICQMNQLTTLNVTKNTKLTRLSFMSNNLSQLDLGANTMLKSLYGFQGNPLLTSLNIRNNRNLEYLDLTVSSIKTLYVWWTGGVDVRPASFTYLMVSPSTTLVGP